MFAKRFFYVCAGLFLLALSYHFGARTATAQSGVLLTAGGIDNVDAHLVAVSGTTPYRAKLDSNAILSLEPALPNIPSGRPVVAIDVVPNRGNLRYVAILEDGSVYRFDGSSWQYAGNMISGTATLTRRESFGAMKSRYRGERGAAQPAPQDR